MPKDVDFENKTLSISRSLQQCKDRLRFSNVYGHTTLADAHALAEHFSSIIPAAEFT